jgi:hypothetical protein
MWMRIAVGYWRIARAPSRDSASVYPPSAIRFSLESLQLTIAEWLTSTEVA